MRRHDNIMRRAGRGVGRAGRIVASKLAVLVGTALVGVAGVAGCTRPSAVDQAASLDEAQALIDYMDFGSAQSICDEVRLLQLSGGTSSDGDAAVLGRLSILYMKLADATGREENIGHAYQCYLEAYAADSIAASDYYSTLSVEEMPQGVLLASIVSNALLPDEVLAAEASDSLPADTLAAPAPPSPKPKDKARRRRR